MLYGKTIDRSSHLHHLEKIILLVSITNLLFLIDIVSNLVWFHSFQRDSFIVEAFVGGVGSQTYKFTSCMKRQEQQWKQKVSGPFFIFFLESSLIEVDKYARILLVE